jgi:hypothetical protein
MFRLVSLPRIAVWVVLAILALGADQPAAQGRSASGAVVYETPTNPQLKPLYERLKSERWLERMHAVVRAFRQTRPVTLKLDQCGEVDAYYSRRTVGLCYEYLQVIMRRIEAGHLPPWVTAEQALAGAFVEAILHELAHALIEQHRIPVLGREEEAADQISTMIMLDLGGGEADNLIKGAAHVYLSWMAYFQSRPARQLASGASAREARAHPTASQRLYNIVCIAYGADPKSFAAVAKAVDLPEERAEDCDDENALLQRSYRALVRPHVIAANEAEARRELAWLAGRR